MASRPLLCLNDVSPYRVSSCRVMHSLIVSRSWRTSSPHRKRNLAGGVHADEISFRYSARKGMKHVLLLAAFCCFGNWNTIFDARGYVREYTLWFNALGSGSTGRCGVSGGHAEKKKRKKKECLQRNKGKEKRRKKEKQISKLEST